MTRSQLLSDFRMADVQFEVVAMRAQDRIERRTQVAGHFYYVIEGCVEGCATGGESRVANAGETLVVTGYLGHSIEAKNSHWYRTA